MWLIPPELQILSPLSIPQRLELQVFATTACLNCCFSMEPSHTQYTRPYSNRAPLVSGHMSNTRISSDSLSLWSLCVSLYFTPDPLDSEPLHGKRSPRFEVAPNRRWIFFLVFCPMKDQNAFNIMKFWKVGNLLILQNFCWRSKHIQESF